MRSGGLMKTIRKRFTWITTPLLIVAFLLAWKAYVTVFEVSPLILPPPEDVGRALWEMLGEERVWAHARITVTETVAGFAIAVVLGVVLGTLIGKISWLERTLNPFIVATQVVPKVALVPLFILWFGFGPTSKIVVAAVLAFFPIMTNTVLGIKSIPAGHREVMLSMNASRRETFLRLELPSSAPYILTSFEVAIVLATIGAVVGEYLGGTEGLGYLAVASLNGFQVDRLFAVIFLLTAIGFVLYLIVSGARRLIIPWHESVTLGRIIED